LVMVPPTILAITYPRGFIGALEATGAYGDTVLNGLIPLAMFFVGRYWYKYPSGLVILRGRVSLFLLSTFALGVLILQIARNVS